MTNDATKNRIAALMLLTRGQAPSWYNRPEAQETTLSATKKKKTKKKVRGDKNSSVSFKSVICLWIIATSIKVLLFPSYRSTDFLVHRHWKAVTRNLPMSKWYYDDKYVKTKHTFDYPPGFALFESFWSQVVPSFVGVNKQCLALLDDRKVENTITTSCVAFMRSTVIMSDIVWWLASWCIARTNRTLFGLLVFNPALLWLDHVHFQYNGFLLGILLLSVNLVTKRKDVYGAALFGILLSCKHLYVTCGLWFATIWLRRYLWETRNVTRLVNICLAGGLGVCLPVLIVMDLDHPVDWGKQVLSRLFPFQRGLVHDYWAGNVWAFYIAGGKVVRKIWKADLPAIEPATTAGLMLLMQLPALYQVNDGNLWTSFAAMAMSTFLAQYHAHEKAILTSLLPAIVASFTESKTLDVGSFSTVALTSIFPLLFRVEETSFKVCCWVLAVATTAWCGRPTPWYIWLATTLVILQLDFLPTPGRFEFLPLAATSLFCGIYYLYWWLQHALIPCWKR